MLTMPWRKTQRGIIVINNYEAELYIYFFLIYRSDLSESPKHSMLDSPSPTREQKARQAVAEATASTKWKMHVGPGGVPQPPAPRLKKKQLQERPPSPEWPPELPPENPRARNR